MLLEFIGKFYDNHSLSIVNRSLAIGLHNAGINLKITALDSYNPAFKVAKQQVKILKQLELVEIEEPDIQLRHTYPPIWAWPTSSKTKIVFIQPWEFTKAPFEWQYKFETFADALIVPSNFCKKTFITGGINPDNIAVIANGYDTGIFNKTKNNLEPGYGIDPSNFNFVYVGNAQWRKGLDLLLNAWISSFSRADKAHLIIKDNPNVYGYNNTLAETIKMQYKSDCAKITYISDDLSAEEMATIYKASKVLVHPYRAEGFGMHIQEAMACGCMPIVSDNGPTDDFVVKSVHTTIPVDLKVMNITDNRIFALKSGDSATLMGSHCFYNEPNVQAFTAMLRNVYYSHGRDSIINQTDCSKLQTWGKVVDDYITYLSDVARRTKVNRYK